MKIALVSSGSGSRGGGEIYLRFLAQGLIEQGQDATLLIPDHDGMEELAASFESIAPVVRFPYRTTYSRKARSIGAVFDLPQQFKLRALFQSLSVDLVHVNQQVAEDGLDLALAASASRTPWLSTIHVGHGASHLGAQLGRSRDAVTRLTFNRLRGNHIAVSETSRRQMQSRFKANIHTILNGVPKPEGVDLAEARFAARKDWGAAETDIVVGAVGRIEAQKDPLALINHISRLSSQNVRLVWIGDGSMREKLTAHAALCDPPLPIHIDGWRQDSSLRVAGFDVFMMPSVFEGLPLALLEAMHAGVAIIASHADGIAEAIRDGQNGFLCQRPDDWASKLQILISDEDTRKRFAKQAEDDAIQHFSTASMATATLETYQRVRSQALGLG